MKKRRKRKKKPVEGKVREGGKVTLRFDNDTRDALEEVRSKMSEIVGERVSSATIVRLYLVKGLEADKALPRPVPVECSVEEPGS